MSNGEYDEPLECPYCGDTEFTAVYKTFGVSQDTLTCTCLLNGHTWLAAEGLSFYGEGDVPPA